MSDQGYAIVIENAGTNFSAYAPDLPGCVATGASQPEVERAMRSAIELHLEGMRAEGIAPPEPQAYATVLEVAA